MLVAKPDQWDEAQVASKLLVLEKVQSLKTNFGIGRQGLENAPGNCSFSAKSIQKHILRQCLKVDIVEQNISYLRLFYNPPYAYSEVQHNTSNCLY